MHNLECLRLRSPGEHESPTVQKRPSSQLLPSRAGCATQAPELGSHTPSLQLSDCPEQSRWARRTTAGLTGIVQCTKIAIITGKTVKNVPNINTGLRTLITLSHPTLVPDAGHTIGAPAWHAPTAGFPSVAENTVVAAKRAILINNSVAVIVDAITNITYAWGNRD